MIFGDTAKLGALIEHKERMEAAEGKKEKEKA
jgi:hypothetical protein